MTRTDAGRRIAWIGGSEHSVVLDEAATGGRLAIVRSTMLAGAAAPIHVHPDEDETIMMVSGSVMVWIGADRWQIGGGDTIFMPRGVPHAYTVIEDTDWIAVCNPAGMDRFFDRAGWDLSRGPVPEGWQVTRDELAKAAEAGGDILLGPPLGINDQMPVTTWTHDSRDDSGLNDG